MICNYNIMNKNQPNPYLRLYQTIIAYIKYVATCIGNFKGGGGVGDTGPLLKNELWKILRNIEVFIGTAKQGIYNTLTCHF